MTQRSIAEYSHQITSQIPGVFHDLDKAPVTFSWVVKLYCNPLKRQLIRPGRALKGMCSPALTLRKILGGQLEGNASEYKELLQNLKELRFSPHWERNSIQRQVLRLQDLSDGGLGFTVELFFLALVEPLSTSSSKESHSALYKGTFKAITSEWSNHKHSSRTQKLLINIAWSRREEFSRAEYPPYIVDEFISLLGKIFEGQTGPHINEAVEDFGRFRVSSTGKKFGDEMLRVFTRAQVQSS